MILKIVKKPGYLFAGLPVYFKVEENGIRLIKTFSIKDTDKDLVAGKI